MQTIFKHKGIIIGIVAVIVIFVGYLAYKGSSSQAPSSGGVTRQAVSPSTSSGAASGPGQEFVSQLLAIHNINLNLDLFTDPVFIGLQDFSRDIPEQPKYRQNPFAPLNATGVSTVPTGAAARTQAGVTTGRTTGTASGGGIFQATP